MQFFLLMFCCLLLSQVCFEKSKFNDTQIATRELFDRTPEVVAHTMTRTNTVHKT